MTGPTADPADPRAGLMDVTGDFTHLHNRCHAALAAASPGDEDTAPDWAAHEQRRTEALAAVQWLDDNPPAFDDDTFRAYMKLVSFVMFAPSVPPKPPQSTVPRAPVEALHADLLAMRADITDMHPYAAGLDCALAAVRRHLNGDTT